MEKNNKSDEEPSRSYFRQDTNSELRGQGIGEEAQLLSLSSHRLTECTSQNGITAESAMPGYGGQSMNDLRPETFCCS